MPRRVHRPAKTPMPLPSVFARLIHAARLSAADTGVDLADRIGHASALEEFAAWAIVNVPARGILAPREGTAFTAIQAIAARHLGYADASQAFRRAIKAVGDAEVRNEVESAANHVQSITDDAYYYAGLASGVVMIAIGKGE
jgi:hypothetical protein